MHAAPLCVIESTLFPTSIAPVLEFGPVFCAIEYETVPFPDPLFPDEMAIQESALFAVQPHMPVVATEIVPLPPEEPNKALAGLIE
jgi:hypothetical protein